LGSDTLQAIERQVRQLIPNRWRDINTVWAGADAMAATAVIVGSIVAAQDRGVVPVNVQNARFPRSYLIHRNLEDTLVILAGEI
jgi:hypothetical protein